MKRERKREAKENLKGESGREVEGREKEENLKERAEAERREVH